MSARLLLLSDFDGTLTRGDSFAQFLWFAVPLPKLAVGSIWLTIRFLFLFFSGKWSNEAGKAAVLSAFFKGKTEAELAALGARFCHARLPKILRPTLLARLRHDRASGARVVIVSASPDVWLRPFCDTEGFDLICTLLAFDAEGRFQGRLATPNCNGAEKARRIRAAYDLATFTHIVAFGNSSGDAAMFALAHEVWRY
jgi:phosphatidylglycerophosphatase C